MQFIPTLPDASMLVKLLPCCPVKFQDVAGSESAHWEACYEQTVIILCKALQQAR